MVPGEIVLVSFNSALVALSYVIAVLGSMVALMAAARIRRVGEPGLRAGYIVLAAFALFSHTVLLVVSAWTGSVLPGACGWLAALSVALMQRNSPSCSWFSLQSCTPS